MNEQLKIQVLTDAMRAAYEGFATAIFLSSKPTMFLSGESSNEMSLFEVCQNAIADLRVKTAYVLRLADNSEPLPEDLSRLAFPSRSKDLSTLMTHNELELEMKVGSVNLGSGRVPEADPFRELKRELMQVHDAACYLSFTKESRDFYEKNTTAMAQERKKAITVIYVPLRQVVEDMERDYGLLSLEVRAQMSWKRVSPIRAVEMNTEGVFTQLIEGVLQQWQTQLRCIQDRLPKDAENVASTRQLFEASALEVAVQTRQLINLVGIDFGVKMSDNGVLMRKPDLETVKQQDTILSAIKSPDQQHFLRQLVGVVRTASEAEYREAEPMVSTPSRHQLTQALSDLLNTSARLFPKAGAEAAKKHKRAGGVKPGAGFVQIDGEAPVNKLTK